MNEADYYPPSKQEHQHKILIYEANKQVGHRLLERFRNDHIIEVNPNYMQGTIDPQETYQNDLDLNLVVDSNNLKGISQAILDSDIVLFTANSHNVQHLQHLLKLLKGATVDHKIKVILINPVFSWRNPKGQRVAKRETYLDRVPLASSLASLERLCLSLGRLNESISSCVVSSGLVYGQGEELLFSAFKQALEQKVPLKVYGTGDNIIPTIHVDDLCEMVFNLAFSKEEGFFYGVDHSNTSQKDIIEGISRSLGNGHFESKLIEDGLLHEYFDVMTADIEVDQTSRPQLDQWKAKDGLVANLGFVVAEFNAARGLKPNKILIHGTPSSGKSKLAELLAKHYGLPLLNIRGLVEELKADNSTFAAQLLDAVEERRAAKIEEQKKAHEELKKKKKGKGVEEFDPEKVVVRLTDEELTQVMKRRLARSDCCNKGYIIDGVLKSTAQIEAVFLGAEEGQLNEASPTSVFNIEATEQQTKQRIKKLPPQTTEGTHHTEEHAVRRFAAFNELNKEKKWSSVFSGKVDIHNVPFDFADAAECIAFVERNGPLGFRVRPQAEKEEPQKEQAENAQQQKDPAEEAVVDDEDEEFDLAKLTQKETQILNKKSRPIRQYLIDNVIPQITEGLLQICKQTPPDPIQFLVHFLEQKRKSKKKGR